MDNNQHINKFIIRKLANDKHPPKLTEIPKPPKELYHEGELPDFNKNKLLTVVGSRKFSSYGKDVCQSLISGLSGYPIVIVSGLALGIDTIAHQSAVKANLKTIAVPGSGLDHSVLYPRSNYRLAREIIHAGGALLSEYSPKTQARPYTFPERNRIMVGMSDAVLLIEAAERSGTLITARLTADYNRELLAVPHDTTRITGKGVNQFIKLGATPITESIDILYALGIDPDTDNQQPHLDIQSLTKDEQSVVIMLENGSLQKDELIEKINISSSSANILFSSMELRDLIRENRGIISLYK
jgi:DNA processing protein